MYLIFSDLTIFSHGNYGIIEVFYGFVQALAVLG